LLTSCLRFLTKRPAILQQLHKTASRGLSAIAELLVYLFRQNASASLGDFVPQTHDRGSAPGPRWGTAGPQIPWPPFKNLCPPPFAPTMAVWSRHCERDRQIYRQMNSARHGGIGRACIASRGNTYIYKNLYKIQNKHSHKVSTRQYSIQKYSAHSPATNLLLGFLGMGLRLTKG